jgi:plastocyanin
VAGAVTAFLGSKGFSTLTATNALVKVTASEIFTVGGATADVSAVATALSLPASSIEPAASAAPVSSTAGANVVVIVGPDLASRFNPATTTAPPG